MVETRPARRASITLALGDHPLGPWFPGYWILPLVVLGSRACRYASTRPTEQLVVALTVPTREFAAALIGCGWIAATPVAALEPPEEVASRLETGKGVRIVTDQFEVMTASFTGLGVVTKQAVLWVGGQGWQMRHITAVAQLSDEADFVRVKKKAPRPGSVSSLMKLSGHWAERLCQPSTDLAIVGTGRWLKSELDACIAQVGLAQDTLGDELRGILLPNDEGAATWSTRVYSTGDFIDQLDHGTLPAHLRAVVLDSASSCKCLGDLEVPVVFAILDRSVADESATDAVLTAFRSRGTPLSLVDDLKWQPPAGIEALAFTVPL